MSINNLVESRAGRNRRIYTHEYTKFANNIVFYNSRMNAIKVYFKHTICILKVSFVVDFKYIFLCLLTSILSCFCCDGHSISNLLSIIVQIILYVILLIIIILLFLIELISLLINFILFIVLFVSYGISYYIRYSLVESISNMFKKECGLDKMLDKELKACSLICSPSICGNQTNNFTKLFSDVRKIISQGYQQEILEEQEKSNKLKTLLATTEAKIDSLKQKELEKDIKIDSLKEQHKNELNNVLFDKFDFKSVSYKKKDYELYKKKIDLPSECLKNERFNLQLFSKILDTLINIHDKPIIGFNEFIEDLNEEEAKYNEEIEKPIELVENKNEIIPNTDDEKKQDEMSPNAPSDIKKAHELLKRNQVPKYNRNNDTHKYFDHDTHERTVFKIKNFISDINANSLFLSPTLLDDVYTNEMANFLKDEDLAKIKKLRLKKIEIAKKRDIINFHSTIATHFSFQSYKLGDIKTQIDELLFNRENFLNSINFHPDDEKTDESFDKNKLWYESNNKDSKPKTLSLNDFKQLVFSKNEDDKVDKSFIDYKPFDDSKNNSMKMPDINGKLDNVVSNLRAKRQLKTTYEANLKMGNHLLIEENKAIKDYEDNQAEIKKATELIKNYKAQIEEDKRKKEEQIKQQSIELTIKRNKEKENIQQVNNNEEEEKTFVVDSKTNKNNTVGKKNEKSVIDLKTNKNNQNNQNTTVGLVIEEEEDNTINWNNIDPKVRNKALGENEKNAYNKWVKQATLSSTNSFFGKELTKFKKDNPKLKGRSLNKGFKAFLWKSGKFDIDEDKRANAEQILVKKVKNYKIV